MLGLRNIVPRDHATHSIGMPARRAVSYLACHDVALAACYPTMCDSVSMPRLLTVSFLLRVLACARSFDDLLARPVHSGPSWRPLRPLTHFAGTLRKLRRFQKVPFSFWHQPLGIPRTLRWADRICFQQICGTCCLFSLSSPWQRQKGKSQKALSVALSFRPFAVV